MMGSSRLARIAPLLVFFLIGLSAFDNVAMTYFVRDRVRLSAAELVEIGIWTSMPWSVKIAFGAVIDSFRLLGNNRRSYILLGAFIQFLGLGLFSLFVAGISPVGSEYTNLLVSGLLTTVGTVFSQTTANTLAIETVPERQIGGMQVAVRIALSAGAVIAAALTGYLAAHYSLTLISAWKLLLPAGLVVGALCTLPGRPGTMREVRPQWGYLGVAAGFILFCVLTRSQVAVFLAQMVVINYLLWKLSRGMAPTAASGFLLSCLAIFLFRLSPDVGPGFSWWMIGGLHFDETYLGTIRLIATCVDIGTLLLLSRVMAQGRILRSLTWLTVVSTVVSIPAILVYYGWTGGLDPRHIFLVDTAVAAPLADLAMIPLGILIARAAPEEGRAMYMAVTASFMNMALLGGDLITRGLNTVYVVSRTDYSQLGMLLLITTGIGLGLSVLGLLLLRFSGSDRGVIRN